MAGPKIKNLVGKLLCSWQLLLAAWLNECPVHVDALVVVGDRDALRFVLIVPLAPSRFIA